MLCKVESAKSARQHRFVLGLLGMCCDRQSGLICAKYHIWRHQDYSCHDRVLCVPIITSLVMALRWGRLLGL